ncbi:MAG: ribosome silencing factor [Hyphomicrobiales bacterium]|nr:ribosome silencing factor [Hyphomicrobiales bacterium]
MTSVALQQARKKPLGPARGRKSPAAGAQPGKPDAPQQDPQLLRLVLESLEDAKAEDIVSIDLGGKTSLADAMAICSGRSNTHVGAIADRVIKACKAMGVSPRIEGMPQNDWALIDAGDVIVHVFRPEVRQFYNLEKMWAADRPGERKQG